MSAQLLKATVSFGALIAIVLLAQLYDQSLFDWSLENIPKIQADASESK